MGSLTGYEGPNLQALTPVLDSQIWAWSRDLQNWVTRSPHKRRNAQTLINDITISIMINNLKSIISVIYDLFYTCAK